ncbi:Hypothetical predicted protein [Paramuricea clavata]|uniref:Uncharacterized protein n=1 Tax=Paramuricea clavata TaxID=317549 RepID=A0A6S7G311_PARCT|nr:Hypothetical predicted protein [Paramuricea clavata]
MKYKKSLQKVEKVYDDLVQKHKKFTELIEEDKEFEVEKHWLEECQQQFLSLESRAKEYVQKTLNEKSLSEKADKEQAEVTDGTSEICAFKIEKPKLSRLNGDVRDYAIFKSDFKHIIGTKYNNRDAITLLRTALSGKPLEMMKVTQDIMKFKPLRNEEDSRFCELVHLVRRSYNTLKELGRPHDMDNNHILAIIEQKMCNDDRKTKDALLPIVSGFVVRRNGEREESNILMDSGAQISLIRTDVAHD